jgi:hypothetical protein
MLVGTHAMLPVCGCLAIDGIALNRGGGRVFPGWSLWVIGFFGVLPDFCSPHIALEDRHVSWSHTVWFLAGLLVLLPMVGVFLERSCRWQVVAACWIAAFLHVAADTISGGVAWLYPWKTEVTGEYYIPLDYWVGFDAAFVLLTWCLLRSLPKLEGRAIRRAQHREVSES